MSYMIRNLLPLNLQFFAEDGGAGEGGSGDAGGNGDSGDWIDEYYKNGDEGKNENMIPKSRFDEVNKKYKELSDSSKVKQSEYDEMSKKSKESEDTIKAHGQRIESLEKLISGMLDSEMEAIDEEFHDLIPTDKPIEEQLDWLRKAKAKGVFGNKGMEFEIGQPSNPRGRQGATRTDGMSTMQLLTMGYSTK